MVMYLNGKNCSLKLFKILNSSPTKLNRSISQNATGTPQTPTHQQNRVNGFLTPSTPAPQTSTPGTTRTPSADKPATGGPPTSGLYSTPKQRRALHAASSATIGGGTPIAGRFSFGTPVSGTHNLSIGTPSHQQNGTVHDLGNR